MAALTTRLDVTIIVFQHFVQKGATLKKLMAMYPSFITKKVNLWGWQSIWETEIIAHFHTMVIEINLPKVQISHY
jgi:hypothetical protein